MKITVHIKDPDGFSEAIGQAVSKSLKDSGLSSDEEEALAELRQEKYEAALEKWVDYGENVTLEFDLEKGTAVVKERSR